ncbi:MAG: UDP-N-acetylglucosamine--N-acetylmuramyl-(pentapeptide) pyrophosphoryl-undecaprenol N-acetylglucosamine transferase [candidate division WWE3 bacterium]|nr:UDP-N-acetylglucosamine--N-acetylmuramyl-(pentapeptide) pyrophosphoryl-undecaprenol N-acetylglucosamine transferase [candidate division WWE3 bacterium]
MQNNKVVFVGGHHTPVLAIIEALQNNSLEFDFYWVGHRFSMWGDTRDSAEYKEVTALKIPFFDLKAGKFYHTYNPFKLIRIPWGFIRSFWYLLRLQPDLVVTFGGYLSVPVAFNAWLLGIPVITHEQTVTAGLANKFVAHFAKLILLTWPQSLKEFPKDKSEVIGLPLRSEIVASAQSKEVFDATSPKPLIYITGGKQGSHVINEAALPILTELLDHFRVVHQCGSNSINNDLDRLLKFKMTLPSEQTRNYEVSDYFDAKKVAKIMREASLIISRSGANTTYELLAFGKPAILIPLPNVSHNEQFLQAKILADTGAAIIINQSDLTPAILLDTINKMFLELPDYKARAEGLRNLACYDAAEKFAQKITTFIK